MRKSLKDVSAKLCSTAERGESSSAVGMRSGDILREREAMIVKNEKGWLGQSAESLHRHYFDGLCGNRCGFYMGPWVTARGSLTWDSVTCPDCRKLKEAWEPETVEIDTRGD